MNTGMGQGVALLRPQQLDVLGEATAIRSTLLLPVADSLLVDAIQGQDRVNHFVHISQFLDEFIRCYSQWSPIVWKGREKNVDSPH